MFICNPISQKLNLMFGQNFNPIFCESLKPISFNYLGKMLAYSKVRISSFEIAIRHDFVCSKDIRFLFFDKNLGYKEF